jgi:pimeloyl-ACP methyl ester carboxylesterase
MGGLVAQLLYRRHAALVSGLVLCSTARDVRESPAEQLAAVAPPPVVAALQWNPVLHLVSAEVFGTALVGRLDDPATASWARTQLRRTTVATAVPAIRAVCGFTSASWISQVGVPTAVVDTTRGPHRAAGPPARAGPGATAYEVDAGHGACITAPQLFAPALLQACWSAGPGRCGTVRYASQTRPTRVSTAP